MYCIHVELSYYSTTSHILYGNSLIFRLKNKLRVDTKKMKCRSRLRHRNILCIIRSCMQMDPSAVFQNGSKIKHHATASSRTGRTRREIWFEMKYLADDVKGPFRVSYDQDLARLRGMHAAPLSPSPLLLSSSLLTSLPRPEGAYHQSWYIA